MTLRGRLLLALAYILLLAVVALEVPLAISLRDRVDAEVRSQARSQADVVAATVAGNLDEPETLDDTVATAAGPVRGRVVVTDLEGALLADSAGTDRLGTDYGDRPEIARALRGVPVQDRRRSDTLDQEILVTAVPVVERGARVGVVRVTQSVSAVSRATDRRDARPRRDRPAGAGARPRGGRRHRAPDRRAAAPARRDGRRASPRATCPCAPGSREARSSAASPPPSTG